MLSLIFFISILSFSEYRSFVSLGRLILRYFILFAVMVNGTVSLISLSDLLLLVYRNAVYQNVIQCCKSTIFFKIFKKSV